MDLKVKGQKMLEALAMDGQIRAKVTALAGITNEVAIAVSLVTRAEENKENGLCDRKEAEQAVAETLKGLEEAEFALGKAQDRAFVAEGVYTEAQVAARAYDDAFLSNLDRAIEDAKGKLSKAEETKDKASKDLEIDRQDLLARQEELRQNGVELAIAPEPAGRTTYL